MCLVCGLPSLAFAQPAAFLGLGTLQASGGGATALGVSADGAVVVGASTSDLGPSALEAFRWTQEGGMVGLGALSNSLGPFSKAHGVSSDGAVVAGWTHDTANSLGNQACFWAASSGFVLQELVAPPRPDRGAAFAVSDDGLTIVGTNEDGPFRQAGGSGMIPLGTLPGDIVGGSARGVSADGSVITGWARNASGIGEAFVWTEASGLQGLGDLPGGGFSSDAFDVSADGGTVVGTGNGSFGSEAFRWTASTGMVGLGDLPGGDVYSLGRGVSADGSVVVGMSRTGSEETGDRAFIWDTQHGMRDLRLVLWAQGIDMQDWTLIRAEAVSDDGRVVVGEALGPNGSEAFYARLGEPVGQPVPGLGTLGLLVLAGLLGVFGSRSGDSCAPGSCSR